MPTLSAKFCLEVSSPCLLAWPDGQVPEVVTMFDNFRVAAKLLSAEHWRSKGKDDIDWTTGLCKIEIEVSRVEIDQRKRGRNPFIRIKKR